jgi:hypothetical protein
VGRNRGAVSAFWRRGCNAQMWAIFRLLLSLGGYSTLLHNGMTHGVSAKRGLYGSVLRIFWAKQDETDFASDCRRDLIVLGEAPILQLG